MTTAPEPNGIVWHTSSYSGTNGNCVEVGWRTSSHSGTNGACVEVAPTADAMLVRDSKNRTGPALTVPPAAWQAFLTTLTRYLTSWATLARTTRKVSTSQNCATVLGQPRLLLWIRSKVGKFVSPAGTKNGRPFWHEDDVYRWAVRIHPS